MSRLDIKHAIKSRGLTIASIAQRMGVTPVTLNGHINGQNRSGCRVAANPSVDVLQRIAAAIGCDIVDLFVAEEKKIVIPEDTTQDITCPNCGCELTLTIKKKQKP